MANFVAMAIAAQLYVGWGFVLYFFLLCMGVYRLYSNTADKLFSTASIVKYWRADLGGAPDADDPFELEEACEHFKACARIGREMSRRAKCADGRQVKFARQATRRLSAPAKGAASPGRGQHLVAGGII